MRKLCLQDTFRFARLMKLTKSKELVSSIVETIGIEQQKRKRLLDQISKKLEEAPDDEKASIKASLEATKADNEWMTKVGIDAFLSILECAAENGVEDSVYRFLAPVWETKPEDVAAMSIEACIDNIKQMVAENDFLRFFDSAQKTGSQ